MISIDASLIPAILIFLAVVVGLNYILLRPLYRVLDERAARTAGVVEAAKKDVNYSVELFNQYEAAIRRGRADGYRLMDSARDEASKNRARALAEARSEAERMVEESRKSIQQQAAESKSRLSREVDEIAQEIATSILGRSA
jgi:F-type H+-transporting ATPase subunit b